VIVHLLELYPADGSTPSENYRKIRGELEAFSPQLAGKQELVAANKLDLAVDDEALVKLQKDLPEIEILAISGATHQGLEKLLETLWAMLVRTDACTS
jgi:GTP-binding protein